MRNVRILLLLPLSPVLFCTCRTKTPGLTILALSDKPRCQLCAQPYVANPRDAGLPHGRDCGDAFEQESIIVWPARTVKSASRGGTGDWWSKFEQDYVGDE